jgi:hypothetical protein
VGAVHGLRKVLVLKWLEPAEICGKLICVYCFETLLKVTSMNLCEFRQRAVASNQATAEVNERLKIIGKGIKLCYLWH